MALAIRLHPARLLLTLALVPAGTMTAQSAPEATLQLLQAGNQRFATGALRAHGFGDGARRTLARGESARAIVLCCSDSRVPPEHVFDVGLGELVVVRVAGHVVDAEAIATIEHAVQQADVSLCVVLGHEGCGAVGAALAAAGTPAAATTHSEALRHLLERIEPAVRRARALDLEGGALAAAAEVEHVHATVHDCLRRSPLLRQRLATGRLQVVGARYLLASGVVEWLPHRALPVEPGPATAVAPEPMALVAPHVALQLLQAGHRRFLGDGLPTADRSATRRERLTHGQQPVAIVLGCADSRTPPEHLFDAGLGDLFVVRLAGGALSDDAVASIEYAAQHLGAPLLVVMAHTGCTALQAAAGRPERSELTPHQRRLLLRLEPSVAAAGGGAASDLAAAARRHALRTVDEARARSPLLRSLEACGRFALVACVHDLATGDLTWPETDELSDVPAAHMAPPAPAGETAPGDTAPAPPTAPAPATADQPAPAAAEQAPPPVPAVDRRTVLLIALSGAASLLVVALLLGRGR